MSTAKTSIWSLPPELGIPEPPALLAESDKLWLAYFCAADDAVAVVQFTDVIDHHLSPINDEGLGQHLYGRAGLQPYSFNELDGSQETLRWSGLKARHWVITFKDNTLDVVARSGEVIASGMSSHSPLKGFVGGSIRWCGLTSHPSGRLRRRLIPALDMGTSSGEVLKCIWHWRGLGGRGRPCRQAHSKTHAAVKVFQVWPLRCAGTPHPSHGGGVA